MDTLLASNDVAALVGDLDGRVRTAIRSATLSSEEWDKELRYDYQKPEDCPDAEGAPISELTGEYWHDEKGQMVGVLEGVKPYETFSDESVGLSVRAAFLPNVQLWVIADRDREATNDAD
ncbi:MAG: hypothetical protein H7Z16_08745 [Pyrinomonadaceae bacterium]|nr:hypothetical protein [Pyrinomonadaceae bacterium]